jgi:uncharacterized protein GlcG (DUF336 family)
MRAMLRPLLAAAPLLLLTQPAVGQQAPAPPAASAAPAPAYGPAIGLDEAQALAERTVAEARKRGFRMAVAIVDPSGELIAFLRMDDTQFGSIRIAEQKARTSARMKDATADFEKRVLGGRTVTLAVDEVLPIAGGVPILRDGRIIGAIGVSGGSAAQDDEVARAALAEAR